MNIKWHSCLVEANGIRNTPKLTSIQVKFWCDYIGAAHFEWLPVNVLITAEICCQLLKHLNTDLKENKLILINCKSVMFYHDNAWCYSVFEKLQTCTVLKNCELMGKKVPSHFSFPAVQKVFTKTVLNH